MDKANGHGAAHSATVSHEPVVRPSEQIFLADQVKRMEFKVAKAKDALADAERALDEARAALKKGSN